MANRYDRDPDDYGVERRDASRQEEQRQGRTEPQGNRYADERQQYAGPNPSREDRNQSEADWRAREHRGPDYRGASGRDDRYREGGYSGNEYAGARESGSLGRGYYSSGRDYSGERNSPGERNEAGERYGRSARGDRSQGDWGRHDERPGYRGYYQEQVWTRDPSTGHLYGYEYGAHLDPRRFNAGDESGDRWRTGVGEQNRRFDIDRGWRGTSGAGTSGYGNTTRGQSHFGKGPKGYVRSDERIREDVCDRLSDDDEVDASDITVTVKNAEVILEGAVLDRRSKHRAEDIAESVSGVKDVTNHLRARKGFLQELGDKLSGQDDAEHHGHSGSGPRASTTGAEQRTAH
jgi:hypothetical protein